MELSEADLRVWITIPNSWDATVSASRHEWNNINEALVYYYPQYNATTVGTFNLFYTDFSAAGLQDAPGYTYNNLTSQDHTASDVHMNSDWTWGLTGAPSTHNPLQHKADVRTVLVHEIGHASGLAHQPPCPPVTDPELVSVMANDWTIKWNTKGDDEGGINQEY